MGFLPIVKWANPQGVLLWIMGNQMEFYLSTRDFLAMPAHGIPHDVTQSPPLKHKRWGSP